MTKPIFKTRCERFLNELQELFEEHDVDLVNGRLSDGFNRGKFSLSTPRPCSDGKDQWFDVKFKEGLL